jgi:hypothetical protein
MPGAMTTRLVVTGLNRYVRNPIYLGAVTIFVGEALLLGRLSLLLYAVAGWVGIAAFVRWYEEPALVRRFGADYQAYRRAVPAWLPRLHPVGSRRARRHSMSTHEFDPLPVAAGTPAPCPRCQRQHQRDDPC